MLIAIPTHEREDRQKAFSYLPKTFKKKCILFAHDGRAKLLKEKNPEATVEDLGKTDGIADVRQRIVDWCSEREQNIFMMDDGCQFYTSQVVGDKRKISPKPFKGLTGKIHYQRMFSEIEEHLEDHAQVGISPRPGNNRQLKSVHSPGRVYSCFGLNLDVLYEVGATFDGLYQKDRKLKLYEDFYLTLYLLTRGISNALLYDYGFMHDHGKSGGNSSQRNNKTQKLCIEALIEEFPDYVTLYQREAKSWGVGEEDFRWECRIQWKKAFEQRVNA